MRPVHARALLQSPPGPKNTQLLHTTARVARLLCGGRATLCSNGRDRTAMSLTLEHGMLLVSEHGVAEEELMDAVTTMRRAGVRRENAAWFTGGSRRFGFNSLQASMLPAEYQPPPAVMGGE